MLLNQQKSNGKAPLTASKEALPPCNSFAFANLRQKFHKRARYIKFTLIFYSECGQFSRETQKFHKKNKTKATYRLDFCGEKSYFCNIITKNIYYTTSQPNR